MNNKPGDPAGGVAAADTVSPATRLLEKRRQMYEKQEDYENKKKESKQAELEFREQEKELRQKDLEIQESMIQFSVFLQENERKKHQAEEKKKTEEAIFVEKEHEIVKKERILKILNKRHKRIELKKNSLLKFESYLNGVREHDPDQFPEVVDILDRYLTLEGKKQELQRANQLKEKVLEELKDRITKYQKEGQEHKLDLTNQVQILMNKKEKIMGQKSLIQENAAQQAGKARDKMSDFSQVLMAINNLDDKCQNYGNEDEHGKKKSTLRFNIDMNGFNSKPKTFDITDDRVKFAIRQLHGIRVFISDLKEINNDLRKNPQLHALYMNLDSNASKYI